MGELLEDLWYQFYESLLEVEDHLNWAWCILIISGVIIFGSRVVSQKVLFQLKFVILGT